MKIKLDENLGRPVPWRVVAAEALPGMRLRVVFVDGTSGEVDLAALLGSDQVRGGRFLKRWGRVNSSDRYPSSMARSNGLTEQISPDAMYDAIRKTGRWSP